MNQTSTDKLAASRKTIRAFGQHYDYDVSYLQDFMDASPGAFQRFEAAMPMARYRKAAPVDLVMIAKMATAKVQDCGACFLLSTKMAREAGVSETVIRAALEGGEGLSAERRDVYDYACAVAANETMDAGLLPRLEQRLGKEVIAELALAILAMQMYPTLRRALVPVKSCSPASVCVA